MCLVMVCKWCVLGSYKAACIPATGPGSVPLTGCLYRPRGFDLQYSKEFDYMSLQAVCSLHDWVRHSDTV